MGLKYLPTFTINLSHSCIQILGKYSSPMDPLIYAMQKQNLGLQTTRRLKIRPTTKLNEFDEVEGVESRVHVILPYLEDHPS